MYGNDTGIDTMETILLGLSLFFGYATTIPYANVLFPLSLFLAFLTQLVDLMMTEDRMIDGLVLIIELIPVLGVLGVISASTYYVPLLLIAFLIQLYDLYKSM